MKRKFEYWLISYKEFTSPKAKYIVRQVLKISDNCLLVGVIEQDLFSYTSFIQYAKARQAIFKQCVLNNQEKKALELLGDFYEVLEIATLNFPAFLSHPLIDYCETIRMTYSYKPVLILTLLECNAESHKVSITDVVKHFIKYYEKKIINGETAEKDGSIFSKTPIDYTTAKKIVLLNPLSVLEKDGVILVDNNMDSVTFSTSYRMDDANIRDKVVNTCHEKLKQYFSSIEAKQVVLSTDKIIIDSLHNLIIAISCSSDGVRKNASQSAINILKKIWEIDSNNSEREPGIDNSLPIGKLVQELMFDLEKSGYEFSQEELHQLLSIEYSKSVFGLYYPFFKKVDISKNLTEQRKDQSGRGRYYNREYSFNGMKFLITSQWYKESRDSFLKWYHSLKT